MVFWHITSLYISVLNCSEIGLNLFFLQLSLPSFGIQLYLPPKMNLWTFLFSRILNSLCKIAIIYNLGICLNLPLRLPRLVLGEAVDYYELLFCSTCEREHVIFVFFKWLISLKMMISSSIHFLANNTVSLFFNDGIILHCVCV
jgi:hypothetical protein